MEILIAFSLGAAIGAIVGIAVYRNNIKRLDPIGDKADDLADKIAKKVESIRNKE
jgi:hypothetical protein